MIHVFACSYEQVRAAHAANKELTFKWGLASFFIFIGTPNGKAEDAQ